MKSSISTVQKNSAVNAAARSRRLAAVGWVAFLTLAVAALGYVREGAFAARLGASAEMDAYVAAFFMPNALYLVVIAGALAPAFIPIFLESATKDKEEAWRVFSAALNLATLGLVALALVGMGTCRWWLPMIFAGFSPHTLELSIKLTYIIFPAVVFLGLAGILGALLNSLDHFVLPAAAPAAYSLMVIPVLFLAKGNRLIYWVAVATAFGLALQLLILLPAVRKRGAHYYPILDFRHPAVIKLVKLGVPLLLYLAAAYGSVGVERYLASRLWPGAVSTVNYAMRLFVLPANLCVAPLSIVLYPSFAREAAHKNQGALPHEITRATRLTIFLALPATVWMMCQAVPVTRFFYERGQFHFQDSLTTARFLTIYSLGILPNALAIIFLRGLYSMQDTLTPLWIEAGSLLFYVSTAPYLTRRFGLSGLASARVVAIFLFTGVLLVVLERRMHLFARAGWLGRQFWKGSASSLVMGVVTWLEFGLLSDCFNRQHLLGRAAVVGLLAISGATVYLAVSYCLRLEEAHSLVGRALNFLRALPASRASLVRSAPYWEKFR
jgi:putative peptidoglycan lipid II flippase